MRKLGVAFACFGFASIIAHAEAGLSSCYPLLKLEVPEHSETELFVVIDQTTPFDDTLRQSVADNLRLFLKPGQAFSILQFSAFTQGRYAQVLVSARLDADLPSGKRNEIPKPQLARFDACMKTQPTLAANLAGAALRKTFGDASTDIAKSDVMASLRDLSGRVRQSGAHRKIVLVASDMLENSSVSGFYFDGAVRQINPDNEMKQAEANNLLGDFGGARAYVIGAGSLAETGKNARSYRDPKTLNALAAFWKAWFGKSNANLVEFGMPALLNPVK